MDDVGPVLTGDTHNGNVLPADTTDDSINGQFYTKVKHHPLHSKNNSIISIDDSPTAAPVSPAVPSRIQLGSQTRSWSAKDVTATRDPAKLLRSQSYRSTTPKLGPKVSLHGLRPQNTQPLPPMLTTEVQSPVESTGHSILSDSTGLSDSRVGMNALVGLRNMLAQSPQDDDDEHNEERRSLFDEVSFNSAPGNLHLISDSALERFVARYGAVNVVRQLASDLAQRESEVFLVRKQQEDRERELKRMLAQCGVSMADVDKRLLNMTATSVRRPKEVLDELLQQAINEEGDLMEQKENNDNDNDNNDNESSDKIIPSGRKPPTKQRSWTKFFLGGGDDKKAKPLPANPESTISEADTASIYSAETNAPSHHEDLDKRSILSGGSSKASHRPRSSSQAFNPVEWIPKTIKDHVPTHAPVSPAGTRRPVELDNIVPQNIQPPTLLASWNNHYGVQDGYLTDRFGFIYDRHKDLAPTQIEAESEETVPELRKENTAETTKQPASVKIDEDATAGIRVLQQNLFQPEVASQHATAMLSKDGIANLVPTKGPNSVRMLLAQLTDMHDTLQKAQTVRWDEFLGKLNTIADAEPSEIIQNGTELLGVSGTGLAGGDQASGLFSIVSGPNGLNLKRKKRSSKEGKHLWREFKTLVLGGVPVAYRAKIWGECSGTRALNTPGVYQSLVDREEESEAMNQIDLDLYRTMPYNVFFGNSGPGVHKLRRVLVAFSRRNPEIGYCQGMNLIAAMLLLVFATEEDAFWLLVSLVENILPAGYFSPPLLTSRADQRVFNHLFSAIFPALSSHLTSIHVEVEAITFDWFLSCFTDTLPPDVLFRVWDVFLCVEGEVYLFRIALALFKIYEAALMRLGSASEVYMFMKQLNNQPVRVEALIREAESLHQVVVDSEVRKMRSEEVKKLLEEFTTV